MGRLLPPFAWGENLDGGESGNGVSFGPFQIFRVCVWRRVLDAEIGRVLRDVLWYGHVKRTNYVNILRQDDLSANLVSNRIQYLQNSHNSNCVETRTYGALSPTSLLTYFLTK